MDQEAKPSRISLRTLLADSQSQILSEPWLKNAWKFVQAQAHYHLVAHPLLGEMGQSALLIFAALFLLSSTAGILSGRYWAMRESLAQGEYDRARGLNAQGQHEQALRRLRAAFHLGHHNREYQMALILTMIQMERYDEARLQLDDILKDDPTNAPANLLLARIAASEGSVEIETAVQFYQRAIYGLWPAEPIRNRIDARFELANFLAAEERMDELRAELIVLATDIRDDVEQLLRVGYLMLFAKAPEQAEVVFTRALGQAPRNAEALAGLAKAQLETGNFAGAEQAFSRAARLNPGNDEIRRQLQIVQSVRAMNPKRRGLSMSTAANRALALLSRAETRFSACADPATLPPEARDDLLAATTRLAEKRRAAHTVETIDADIALAVRLYHDGSDFCGNPEKDEALERLILAMATEQ